MHNNNCVEKPTYKVRLFSVTIKRVVSLKKSRYSRTEARQTGSPLSMNMTNGADTQDCGVLSERSRIPPTPHLGRRRPSMPGSQRNQALGKAVSATMRGDAR